MSCVVDDRLRAVLDRTLAVAARLGLHKLSVTAVSVVTVGPRPGVGTRTVTQTPIYVGDSVDQLNPQVKSVTSRDVFLSPNKLQAQDLKVGPIVMPFSGSCGVGGVDPLTLTGQTVEAGKSKQLYFLVQGPDMAGSGSFYKRVDSNEDSALSFYLFLRSTGEKVPLV